MLENECFIKKFYFFVIFFAKMFGILKNVRTFAMSKGKNNTFGGCSLTD